MTRLVLTALLIALGAPVRAAESQLVPATNNLEAASGQFVPASKLIAAAQEMLEAKATVDKVAAVFALVGRVSDMPVADAATVEVQAGEMKASWLRPRVGVPVLVKFADGKSRSVTVWFSVTAPARAEVYEANYPRGTSASAIKTHIGAIDLARTHGRSGLSAVGAVPATPGVPTTGAASETPALRLRHAVVVGAAALADDFEPTPAVQAQQSIRIDVGTGVVRLSTKGRALTDGAIGQVIAVLPANASQPVRARVVSDQVVTIEN